jgi:hypothetical protein
MTGPQQLRLLLKQWWGSGHLWALSYICPGSSEFSTVCLCPVLGDVSIFQTINYDQCHLQKGEGIPSMSISYICPSMPRLVKRHRKACLSPPPPAGAAGPGFSSGAGVLFLSFHRVWSQQDLWGHSHSPVTKPTSDGASA